MGDGGRNYFFAKESSSYAMILCLEEDKGGDVIVEKEKRNQHCQGCCSALSSALGCIQNLLVRLLVHLR